jgi:RHS repeat-associated protein
LSDATGPTTYTYDPLGRLASLTQGGSTTSYGYTGDGHLALQTVGGTSTWYVRGWGQELSREQAGALIWLVGDRLGSVRAEYTSAGTLTTSLNYDPFGAPEGSSTPSDYGYTGEPQGAGAGPGLVQLRARWYAPGQGRFLSRDPCAGQVRQPASTDPDQYFRAMPS